MSIFDNLEFHRLVEECDSAWKNSVWHRERSDPWIIRFPSFFAWDDNEKENKRKWIRLYQNYP